MMAKVSGFVAKEVSKDWNQSDSICTLLFQQVEKPSNFKMCKAIQQVEKPSNYKMCKAINVYDNKYRINVYTHEVINDIQSQRISQSYFAKLAGDGSSLEILLKPEPVDPKKKK
ncbi:hypothetical protein EB077_12235 [bacterium]|nr:hypothetical protein [bacterium]